MSLHAGCAVEKGVKWAANKWVWNFPNSESDDGDGGDDSSDGDNDGE